MCKCKPFNNLNIFLLFFQSSTKFSTNSNDGLIFFLLYNLRNSKFLKSIGFNIFSLCFSGFNYKIKCPTCLINFSNHLFHNNAVYWVNSKLQHEY